jgi:catechol 2,3-dioxygenase-like lactoylglutathione lyase family enzyme
MADNEVTTRAVKPPVRMVFHPTLHVPSLEASEEFFSRVFGRTSTLLEVMPRSDTPRPADAPKGYSTFTPINEVLIDSVNPSLHLTDGVQHFRSTDKPFLFNIGWWCDDIDETFLLLRRNGIPVMTQFGTLVDNDETPKAEQGGDMKQFFTPPDQVGLRYQFIPWFPLHVDHRSKPGWSLPPVSDADPLGIGRLSHHVVVTADPDRALRLLVDTLGGTVIHEGRDEARGISGPYVHLADAVFHFGVPDAGTPAAAELASKLPADSYHAMTWKVVDLDRVARHLGSVGVKIARQTDDTIITDASTSLNLPWGFTTKLTLGDPRSGT